MAQLDAYLVEKLREILQRLYSKNVVKNGTPTLHQSDLDLPSTREQQVTTYKRSPFLFPYAPVQESMQHEVDNLSKKSETEASLPVKGSVGETDYLDGTSGVTSDDFGVPQVVSRSNDLQDPLGRNYSDSITYGVEVNCTSSEDIDVTDSLSKVGKVENSEDESEFTRNLHEFIHILKMSLKSATNEHDPMFPEKDGVHASESYGNSRAGDSITATGIEAATHMEFNLTLDDITDLNNLLEDDDSTFGVPVKHILIIVIYLLIACVSIVGNLLVVQLVIRSRRFHTLTHALLANLAAADLCLATFNIPFSAARVILSQWPFGSLLCRTVPFVQVTSVYATSFTMAVIAVDRYQVIMNPLGKRLKCSEGVFLVIAIWIVSAILSIPYALNHQVVTVLTIKIVRRCQADFASLQARRLLTVATFLAQYLLPLLFTTASYIAIMRRLWHRSSGLGSTTPRQVATQSRAKRKTIKMLVLTVICFALSWAPINIYHLLTHFSYVRHNSTAILICHIIAMSSALYNPFIFCGLNEHFRREAIRWLYCFRTRRSPIVHPGAEVNGMLARADQASRRNVSSTVVNTTVSSRRSPQHHVSVSPRSCQRRRVLAASNTPVSTPASSYMTPRHNMTNSMERVEMSPIATRLASNLESERNGNGHRSMSRYQPELLFLVKERFSSTNTHENEDPDDVDTGPDCLQSLYNDRSSYGGQTRDKKENLATKDNGDKVSKDRDKDGGADSVCEEDDGKTAETTFMGQRETTAQVQVLQEEED